MLIDFHTHIFPDKIAKGAIDTLKKNASEGFYTVTNHTNGTLEGLKESMRKNGVDISVILPVATSARQTETINNFAHSIQSKSIISFGGIHPDCENPEEILTELKERGFKGIKLHPEYQQCDVDSKKSIRILKKAQELELYTVLHCGIDVGIKPPVHCAPRQLKNALEYVSGKFIIAAHMGGFDMFDQVEKYLVGTEVYMDTSAISGIIEKQQLERIIKSHGSEKILFASDSPWDKPQDILELIKNLDLSEEDFSNITYKNALKILDLQQDYACEER